MSESTDTTTDPERAVEVTVPDGMLRIGAERRDEGRSEEEGCVRRELRTGSVAGILPLPDGVTEDDIEATYERAGSWRSTSPSGTLAARKIPIPISRA